jgi:thiol-disulfide isomerase/thioredoxin
LRPSTAAVAPRPTLQPGSPAPPFDVAGFSLAAARGRVVLVDFFSAGCHFCIDDLPWLAALHERHGAALAFVTIAAGTAPDATHPWPTVVENDEPGVAALYRVDAYPAYFVIDRDGRIACARCRRDEAEHVLARLLAER